MAKGNANEGFTIPLEGDAAPFREAVASLRGSMGRLQRQMTQGNTMGRREVTGVGRAWKLMGTAARAAGRAGRAGLRSIALTAKLARRAVGGVFGAIGAIGRMLPMGGLLGGAGLIAGAMGLKKAFDVGGELSDLSARTGIAVRDLALLQQAFENNGVGADKVGDVINKMQRSLSDARSGMSTQTRALDRMGLSVEDLLALAPAEQFEAIQKAIAAMPSAADRAATAMEIFGRSGGDLLTLFADGGAMSQARDTIGAQAGILERNAARFDRVSDLLKSAGVKLRGLFVGIAEQVAPVLLQALEAINKVDFTAIGQRIGRMLLTVLAAFKEGRMGELVGAGMSLAMHSAIDVLLRGLRGAVAFLTTALPPIFGMAMAKFKDPVFWSGLAKVFDGMGSIIGAAVARGMGMDERAAELTKTGRLNMDTGRLKMARSGGGADVGQVLGNALSDGLAAAAKAMGGAAGPGLVAARDEMGRIAASLDGTVKELADQIAASPPSPGGPGGLEMPEGGAGRPGMATIAQSMASIGGGGRGFTLGMPMLTESRRQTGLLQKIAANTQARGGAGVAVFAR